MSSSTNNWELGVVGFYDSFEDYDRFASFGAQYKGKEDSTWSNTISFDDTLSSDYQGNPFYLTDKVYENGGSVRQLPGSAVILGPSSSTAYSGAIERATLSIFSDGTTATLVEQSSSSNIALPTATYEAGDPILIRTVPLGWAPYRAMDDDYWNVSPINRFDPRQSQVAFTFPGACDYSYEYQQAVRLCCNWATNERPYQYIQRVSDPNTFSADIRCWRSTWNYRIGEAWGQWAAPGDLAARIRVGPMTADSEWIDLEHPAGGVDPESGNFEPMATDSVHKLRSGSSLFAATQVTDDWTYAEAFMSGYKVTDAATFGAAGSTYWSWGASDDGKNSAANRASRWGVEIGLIKGLNTAFDVDDLIIEHAHGTSQEANGFYAIQDFPEQSSITAQPMESAKRNRLANGSLKQITTSPYARDKIILSAEFRDVSVDIFRDMQVLTSWFVRGYLIALRPKIQGLPEVMVGALRLRRNPSSHWSLGICSFTLEFEEA